MNTLKNHYCHSCQEQTRHRLYVEYDSGYYTECVECELIKDLDESKFEMI